MIFFSNYDCLELICLAPMCFALMCLVLMCLALNCQGTLTISKLLFPGFKELNPKDFCGRYTADNLVGTSLGLAGQCLSQLPGGPAAAGTVQPEDEKVPRFNELGESVFKREAYRTAEVVSFFLFPEINYWFG